MVKAGQAFAGPYDQSLDPAAFRVYPGVAPAASLLAFKVFGCDGSTNMLAAALDRAADPNQDGNFEDRVDVVNASLGTSYGLGSPTNDELIQNLTAVGTLMVVAAGNSGQSFFCMGAPGSAPEVLSVAASADNQFMTLTASGPEGGCVSASSSIRAKVTDRRRASSAKAGSAPARPSRQVATSTRPPEGDKRMARARASDKGTWPGADRAWSCWRARAWQTAAICPSPPDPRSAASRPPAISAATDPPRPATVQPALSSSGRVEK